MQIPVERIVDLLDYDPETGSFFWKHRKQGRSKGWFKGSMVGGYRILKIDGVQIGAHIVAWVHVHRRYPEMYIDHINLRKSDNRISNLREANGSQNQQNTRARGHNKSGFKGVAWEKVANRWRAQITANGKRIHIGYFDCPKAASEAYKAKAIEVHSHVFSAE